MRSRRHCARCAGRRGNLIVWNGKLDIVAKLYRDMPMAVLPRKFLRFYGLCIGQVGIGVVRVVKGPSDAKE